MDLEILVQNSSRLDKAIRNEASISVMETKEGIKTGQIKVNGHVVKKPSFQVRKGDRISGKWQKRKKEIKAPKPLEIIYEDAHLIVINKPSGLLSVPTSHSKRSSALDKINRHLKEKNFSNKAMAIHRLDRFASGVLMFAKNFSTKENMMAFFKDKQITKTYLAIVRTKNFPFDSKGEISIFLKDNRSHSKVIIGEGKDAKTSYEILNQNPEYSLIRAITHTGRRHQVRAHFAHGLVPILGDILYGDGKDKEKFTRLMLHAESIAFPHPQKGKVMTIKTLYPRDFESLIELT